MGVVTLVVSPSIESEPATSALYDSFFTRHFIRQAHVTDIVRDSQQGCKQGVENRSCKRPAESLSSSEKRARCHDENMPDLLTDYLHTRVRGGCRITPSPSSVHCRVAPSVAPSMRAWI